MTTLESKRKNWNNQQKEFRQVLLSFTQHQKAIKLFLEQHSVLHPAKMSNSEDWSFENAVFKDMTEEQIRRIPAKSEHSIAWLIWHLARIEDVAMNMLVAGTPQVLVQDDWHKRMKVKYLNTGNLMAQKDITTLSNNIEIEILREYRMTVGRRTREIVKGLQPEELKLMVAPSRLQRVLDEGAVVKEAMDLIDYWSKRKIAELLLMPPTRHNFVHLNECATIKKKTS